MAVSAFKSASRRGSYSLVSSKASSDKETGGMATKKTKVPEPPRRSRSVSAFARTQTQAQSQSSVSSDFLTTRDNPLFWDAQYHLTNAETPAPTRDISSADSKWRGRSVSRNTHGGRSVSVSREDTVSGGRRFRSMSRQPVSRNRLNDSERQVEQESRLSPRCSVTRNGSMLDRIKSGQTDNCATASHNLREEDRFSMGSLSEAEEKTIGAVCEQMIQDEDIILDYVLLFQPFEVDNLQVDGSASAIYKTVRSEVQRAISDIQNDLRNATRRSNGTAFATTNITDMPPDLVSPSAIELVLDIRSEYAKKLEQSQERARKLRAELAVEEHREVELSRILKEVLPHPKAPNVQKPRPGRKSSIERRMMSKRLTEEAMTYFDECISLSTFDSSDFSSQEDPPHNLMGASIPVRDKMPLPNASSSISTAYCSNPCLDDNQEMRVTCNSDPLELSASSSTKRPTQAVPHLDSKNVEQGGKYRFSFSRKPTEAIGLQVDIRKYVKNFENEKQLDDDEQIVRSNPIDLEKYDVLGNAQSLLFDRVFFKNRLESGSLLLCGGRIANLSSFFASMI